MRRRGQSSDPGFGSDSFLDVLSNVVGILIILIVMAGMQLSRTPVVTGETTPPIAAVAPSPAPVIESAESESVPIEPESAPSLEVIPDDLQPALGHLQSEKSGLTKEQAEVSQELAELLRQQSQLEEELARSDRDLFDRDRQMDKRRNMVQRIQEQVLAQRQKLSGVLAEFEAEEKSAPAVNTIRHRLTPVSQEVTGDEVHFRLAGGRVSVVPLQELLERVKQQVERRREIAAARGGYKGLVGPIDGYSLEFVIEVRRMSPQEERVHGLREGYSLELSRCTVIPDPNFVGETLEEALKRGSRFAMALRTASSGAALTFWTYPDSFALYRELSEASHTEGFLVAARPMPFGQNIIGDRRLGTRSAAQ